MQSVVFHLFSLTKKKKKKKEYGGGLAGGGGDRVLLSGSLAVLNAFGRGEAFRSTASYSAPGSAGHFAMDISLRKPLLWASTTVPVAWSALLHLHEIDRSAESSHIERLGSLTAAFHYGTVSWRLTSTLSRLMPYQWRDRESSQPECSQANLLQFGWRPKTSLGMEWIVDTRDNPLCAMEGSLRRGSVEFAGSPQMQRLLYLKGVCLFWFCFSLKAREAEAGVQHSQLVWFGGSVTLRARAGHIVPLGDDGPRGSTPRLTSVDAFFLGGAAELPGFQARGAGRTSSLESLGAASYWLTSAHWTLPVPGAPEMLRVQFHASAAGLAGLLGGPPEQRDLSHAFSPDALRASAGVGLVAAIPGTGRVSVSISKILAARLEDNTTQLFQLGFATSFD